MRKRQRISADGHINTFCQQLIKLLTIEPSEKSEPPLLLPDSIARGKTKLSLDAMQLLFDDHGFRTSLVVSPRLGLSIYKDSCKQSVKEEQNIAQPSLIVLENGRAFLLAMLGMHPCQEDLEQCFKTYFKSLYTFKVFLALLRRDSPTSFKHTENAKELKNLLQSYDRRIQGLICGTLDAADFSAEVKTLISILLKHKLHFRIEQLENEYLRIQRLNSTMSNTLLQLFMNYHECGIHDILYRISSGSQAYERITLFLHNPVDDAGLRTGPFIFLPALSIILSEGLDVFVDFALESFWNHILKFGYIVTPAVKHSISIHLGSFLISGIAPDPSSPFSIKAHFHPTYPLSFYLWGSPGSGKSSVARMFPPALQATLQDLVDPEHMVRFVKQTLNKATSGLDMELTTRPNNNDMSVMGIIQSRRMTLSQSKPGLVIVHMEEMPGIGTSDPNQETVCRLVSQRFGGKTRDYLSDESMHGPRNSNQRSIGNDATLVTFFTSNEMLHDDGKKALSNLPMFSNLVTIQMDNLSGKDREDFAYSYLRQCVLDRVAQHQPQIVSINIKLDIEYGHGDIRPLVRCLRQLAFFVCYVLEPYNIHSSTINLIVQQHETRCMVQAGKDLIELSIGIMGVLFPTVPHELDMRTVEVMRSIDHPQFREEIHQALECFFSKALSPVVIVSNNGLLIAALVYAVAQFENVHCFPSVRVAECKMMRSLYDSSQSYNLRDDILRKVGRGSCGYGAIELLCQDQVDQFCIREMIEDSPSLTAFSTSKSALHKTGLFFGVHIVGAISSQIKSRATLII